jgi:hypothetical protein
MMVSGKSSSRLFAITSSSSTNVPESPTRKRRGMPAPIGSLTRESTDTPSPGVRTLTSRFSERFETNGNGCAGSIDCGVTSGKMLSM